MVIAYGVVPNQGHSKWEAVAWYWDMQISAYQPPCTVLKLVLTGLNRSWYLQVSDFGEKVEDSTFLNALQNQVTKWIREIQKVTKLDRDPSSGTALQVNPSSKIYSNLSLRWFWLLLLASSRLNKNACEHVLILFTSFFVTAVWNVYKIVTPTFYIYLL